MDRDILTWNQSIRFWYWTRAVESSFYKVEKLNNILAKTSHMALTWCTVRRLDSGRSFCDVSEYCVFCQLSSKGHPYLIGSSLSLSPSEAKLLWELRELWGHFHLEARFLKNSEISQISQQHLTNTPMVGNGWSKFHRNRTDTLRDVVLRTKAIFFIARAIKLEMTRAVESNLYLRRSPYVGTIWATQRSWKEFHHKDKYLSTSLSLSLQFWLCSGSALPYLLTKAADLLLSNKLLLLVRVLPFSNVLCKTDNSIFRS